MDTPEDPITVMAEVATELHELFMAYRAAGFTEDQAMALICTMVEVQVHSAIEGA